MPIRGRHGAGCQDYPSNVKDSVSILPFKNGGTTTLACAAVAEDLVLVSSLRRFEQDIIARGSHTTGNCSSDLVDTTQNWCEWGVIVGDVVTNTTAACTFGTISAICGNTITATMSADDWDVNDVYFITSTPTHQCARAETIRKVRLITDLAVYIKFDGEATSADHDVHLLAGESYNDDALRIVSRVSIINVVACQTPEVRWAVNGV